MRGAKMQVLRKQREEQSGNPHAQGDSSPPGPARAALGAVRGRLSRGARASQRGVALAALGGARARQLASRPVIGGNAAMALDVFVDDEFGTSLSRALLCPDRIEHTWHTARKCAERSGNVELAWTNAGGAGENAPSLAASQTAPSTWTSLDSFEATRKENERLPSRWAGVRLPQARGTAAAGPVPEPLDIPCDEELAEAPTRPKGSMGQQASEQAILSMHYTMCGFHESMHTIHSSRQRL